MTAVAVADGPGGDERAAIVNRCKNIVEAIDEYATKIVVGGPLTADETAVLVKVQVLSIRSLAKDLAALVGAA